MRTNVRQLRFGAPASSRTYLRVYTVDLQATAIYTTSHTRFARAARHPPAARQERQRVERRVALAAVRLVRHDTNPMLHIKPLPHSIKKRSTVLRLVPSRARPQIPARSPLHTKDRWLRGPTRFATPLVMSEYCVHDPCSPYHTQSLKRGPSADGSWRPRVEKDHCDAVYCHITLMINAGCVLCRVT